MAFPTIFLLPVRISFEIKVRKGCVYADIKAGFAFGLLPVGVSLKVIYRYPFGFIVFIGRYLYFIPELKRKKEKKKKNIKAAVRIKNFLKLRSVSVSGIVGINGRPDVSAMIAGALNSASLALFLPLSVKKPAACVFPSFVKDVFALDISGILLLYPAKLLFEAIKLGRRKLNESSNRKHYAFFNGARKEAR